MNLSNGDMSRQEFRLVEEWGIHIASLGYETLRLHIGTLELKNKICC